MEEDQIYNIGHDCTDKHAQIDQKKDQTALIFCKFNQQQELQQQKISYLQLSKQTNKFANILEEIGICEGDRILIQLKNQPEFVIAFLGAIKAGIIPIPASPLLTPSELDFLSSNSRASLLITDSSLINEDLLGECLGELEQMIITGKSKWEIFDGIFNWGELMELAAPIFTPMKTKLNDPAFWLYTSGTEGKPKAVIHAHRSIPAHDDRVHLWQNFCEGDLVFNTSALNWSYTLTCAVLDILRQGGTSLIYEGPLNSENIFEVTEKYQPTIFMSVPTIYRRLLKKLKPNFEKLNSIRIFLSAGEKLSSEVKENFRKNYSINIQEGLGMTEHSVYLVHPYNQKTPSDSVGKPLSSTHIEILDKNLKPVKRGEIGILSSHQDCPGLMIGYHEESQKLSKPFQKNWFLSGDLAYQDEEGFIYFVSRNDDMITAGGFKISPLEIEQHLNSHPEIQESAVTTFTSSSKNQLIQAHIVLNPSSKLCESEIINYCKTHLASYKKFHHIEFLDQLPKTRNGKIKRKELSQNRIL